MADFLRTAKCIQPDCMNADGYRMTFIVYKNAKLFPVLNASSNHREVSTPIIAGKIGQWNCRYLLSVLTCVRLRLLDASI